jgi:long-chain acyl-CoA synthetase
MGGWGFEAFENAPDCDHFFMVTADPAAASPIEGTQTLGRLMQGQSVEFDPVQTQADDTAIIIYTSGTTGAPKGAELTNSNLMMNTVLLRDLMQYQDSDVSLLVLPLFHVFGLIVQMASGIYHGVTHVLVPKFEPGPVMQLLDRENVSVFCGVPTMYWALLNTETDANLDNISKHLRCCISAGQSIPGATLTAFEEKFHTTIIEGYGMSETSPGITFNRLDMDRKIGSVGTPFWGVNVRVVDPEGKDVAPGDRGEIICRGHNVMKGYFGAPEKTADAIRDGWMHTGDVGTFDEDGYLYILDRIKEMIIRGGENIYPAEVEAMLTEHEAISLVAVIGTPDDRLGEEIKACVVLAEGAKINEAELISWAKNRMAAQKNPRAIEFKDALPMTATGKIRKKELKAREERQLAVASGS